MPVDKRTFTIVIIILAISLPTIILVFHKAFFPILDSIREVFTSGSFVDSATGLSRFLMVK